MSVQFNLVCWHCGKEIGVETSSHPQFAHELAFIAKDVGWHGYIDIEHSRTLIFCCEEHAKCEMKKNGAFRLRPKGIK